MANEPFDLTDLVTRLRNAGLKTDVRQFLAAHELLLAMAGRQPALQDDPEGLASHLGPIFCGSPEEQQLFRQEILAWRGAPRPAPQVSGSVERKKPPRSWLAIACATTVVVGISGGLIGYLQPEPPVDKTDWPPPPPPPPPPPVTTPPRSAFVVSRPVIEVSDTVEVIDPKDGGAPWKVVLAGGLGAAVLAFLSMWWRQKRRRDLVLSRMAPDPDTGRVELNPPPPTVTNIRPVALRRISAGLRRTRANEVFDLSVTATVNETARSGGFVVPVFAPRVAIPEYLVLIDRRSATDHCAQLVYGWITQLCDQGVAADCYEFDSDPRVCREFGTQRSHRLSALLARHHRATVFVCAESAVCIDPLTNRPQPWLRSFSSLPGRVFLTPAPPYRWARQEQQLTEAGFVVAPASPAGLHMVAAMDRNSLEAIGTGAKYAREFPQMLAQDTLQWLDRTPPPDTAVPRLLRALRDFLGPDGYAWLCACAVYPQVTWPLTLKMLEALLPAGANLPTRRAIDEQLPSIARLPWFRYGYMPDWLRKVLIAQLEPEKDARIRALLEQLVCGLMGGQEGGDSAASRQDSPGLLIRTRFKALEIARSAPSDSPLQDEVFLDFLAGAAPDPLSLRLSSMPYAGAPQPRSLATRLRERWRKLGVRHPWVTRAAMSLLVAIPVGIILWAALRATPQPLPDSDITYRLASSDLSSTGTRAIVAPNGRFMLLASPKAGNFVEVWDLARNAVRQRLETAQPRDIVISQRSDRFAIVDEEGEVYSGSITSDLEVRITSRLALASASARNSKQAILTFNSDATLLMIRTDDTITIYEVATWRIVSSRSGNTDVVTHDPDNPGRFLAYKFDTLFWLPANRMPDQEILRKPGEGQVTFSLDGRNLAWDSVDPETRAWNVELQHTISGDKRTQMVLPQEMMPFGWVWSGDGNLVAYEEGRGVNVVYNLATNQELMKAESKLPATNRLYTIRFARSDERRPNYTYYELAERTIDVVTANDAAANDDTSNADTSNDAGNSQAQQTTLMDQVTEKINQTVLATLDSETRKFAQRLIELAANQGVVIRLTDGRLKANFVSHGGLGKDSLTLHEAGRAFDYSVLSDNGNWVVNDTKRMGLVGQIGASIGLTWGGDVDASGIMHFELAAKAEEPTPPEGSDQITAGNDQVLAKLDRETSELARQLLGLTSKAGITVALRSPGRQIRHRSDISQKLDSAGRAFDVAVLMPNGTWTTSDSSTLSQVGRLATGIGFEWSGDWGYSEYSHFELPQPAAQTTQAVEPPPKEQAKAFEIRQPLQLGKSEFHYPGPLNVDFVGGTEPVRTNRGPFTELITTPEGSMLGSFELQLESVSPGQNNYVGQVVLSVRAVRGIDQVREPYAPPSNLLTSQTTLTAREFQLRKSSSKTVNAGLLRFRITLEGAKLVRIGGELAFDRDLLKVRVIVQPQAARNPVNRTPAQAN